jgi:DNA invertase Pin-like site-specific DNA recombinase
MSHRTKAIPTSPPTPGWAIYLRTSSDENQKPELSRARQRFAIEEHVLKHSELPVVDEYVDVLTGTTPNRPEYQRSEEHTSDSSH